MLERMTAGELYHASDPEITAANRHAMAATQTFNSTDATDSLTQHDVLAELLGTVDQSCTVRPNLKVDYGFNVHLGPGCFVNFDAIFLDICPITLGEGCQIGPRAQFLGALHPMENHALRAAGWEFGAPITLGRNVWFGGGVTVLPGVTIGDEAVIGAGSTVTRDIPSRVFAAGSPARVIREL